MLKKAKKGIQRVLVGAAARIGDRILEPRGPITKVCFVLCKRCGLVAEL